MACNAGGKLAVGLRNFEENRLHEKEIYNYIEFQLIKSKTLRRHLLLLVSSTHSIIAVITRIFSFPVKRTR